MIQQNTLGNNMSGLSPEVCSLVREANLGDVRKVYHATKRTPAFQASGAACLTLASIWLCIGILAMLIPPDPASPLWLLPGTILAVLGLWLVLPGNNRMRRHVYLCDAGFLYEKGQERQAVRWDQIDSIQGQAVENTPIGFTKFSYKVRCQDGSVVKLSDYWLESTELVDEIAEQFLRQVVRKLRIVPPRDKIFTQFTLDHQSISDKQETLSWQDIEELTIEKAKMVVLKRRIDESTSEREAGSDLKC